MKWTAEPVEITKEMRAGLEGSGRRIEACQLLSGPSKVVVFTYQVSFGAPFQLGSPPPLLKFSNDEFAIPVSKQIKLASPHYFRELESRHGGVADSMEASFKEELPLDHFCRSYNVRPSTGFENASASVTWATTDFWMFCTSRKPRTTWDFEKLRNEFDYRYAIVIPNPSAFAMQLGKDFGRQLNVHDVRCSGIQVLQNTLLSLQDLDSVVHVSHGQVTYTDRADRFVRQFGKTEKGNVLPFVKRKCFEGQQEYRFVVQVGGEPKREEFFMGISDELRGLTRPYSNGHRSSSRVSEAGCK